MAFRALLALWTNLWCLNLTRPLEILGLSTDPTAFILQIGTNKINIAFIEDFLPIGKLIQFDWGKSEIVSKVMD